jgi:hypothetical protein
MILSTPAVAITLLRYLFQSCVRASEGGKPERFEPMAEGEGRAGEEWMEMEATRWLDALAGVRRSKTRRVESLETEERIEGLWGEKAVL